MHSFRIIVKTPDHIVGHNDRIPGKVGWIERTGDRWLIAIQDEASDVRVDYRTTSLAQAVQTFALKLAGL